MLLTFVKTVSNRLFWRTIIVKLIIAAAAERIDRNSLSLSLGAAARGKLAMPKDERERLCCSMMDDR